MHRDKEFLKNGKVDGRRGNTAAQRAAHPHIVESSKVPGFPLRGMILLGDSIHNFLHVVRHTLLDLKIATCLCLHLALSCRLALMCSRPGVRPSPAIINQKANYEKPESPRTFEQIKRDAEERLKPAKQVAIKCSSPHCHFQAHPDLNETQGQGSYCCKTCKKSGAYGGSFFPP